MLGDAAKSPKAGPSLKFIAVGRTADRCLVSAFSAHPADSPDLEHAALAVLSAPDFAKKVSPGGQYSLAAEVNMLHFTVDEEVRY
jgi:hypothetical protein